MTADRYQSAREHYEERAAIREYCAGQAREDAERKAREEVAKWLKAHPEDKAND